MKNIRPEEITYKGENGSIRVQTDCSQGGRTEQTHRDTCNINTIMAKAVKVGMMPVTERIEQGSYGDYSQASDYYTMNNRLIEIKTEFMKLPSTIRKICENDPGKLIDFLTDPKKREQAIELGLIERAIPEQIIKETKTQASQETQKDKQNVLAVKKDS